MVKSTILIVAVAAVAVAAGACVFFLANNNGDDKDVDRVDIYRELKDGDEINAGFDVVMDFTSESQEMDADTFFGSLYYPVTPEGERAKIKINSTDYDCTIVEYAFTESKTLLYVLDSGFIAKRSVYNDGKLTYQTEVTTTNLDPAKSKGEQVLVKGSYYEMKMIFGFNLYSIDLTIDGTIRTEVDSVDDDTGDIMVKVDSSLSGDVKMLMEVESIIDNKVKFKDAEDTVSMNDAMSLYSYDHVIKAHQDSGYTIAYGEKSSEKKNTEFGKREVISQQLKCTGGPGETMEENCEFGVENVIYKRVMTLDYVVLGGIDLDMVVTYTLYSCTAVSTEKV